MTIYSLEFQSRETEKSDWRSFPAGFTEAQAILEAEVAAQESKGWGVYLHFINPLEDKRGFINPGTGAALVGEDWVCR